MLTAPLAAGTVAVWSGPNAIASSGQDVTVDGFVVPGNATILDGWVLIGSDAMPNRGNGSTIGAGLTANFTQGTHDSTETAAFAGPLSLSIDAAAQQVEQFTGEASLSFVSGIVPGGSNTSLWQPSLIAQINGTVVGTGNVLPHGTIPATAAEGTIVAGTAPGSPVPAGTDAWLEMGNLPIPHPINNFTIEFEHWLHLGGAGDGVWVEYSLDGASWAWTEPVGGYDVNMTNPPTVNGTGGSGVPVWQNTTASGWRTAEFLLDGINGINNASNIDFRFRIATASSGSTLRPGWFIDAFDINNLGNGSQVWHHGCHVTTGTCSYSNNAESALQTTLNLSQAGNGSTLMTNIEWDLEGSSWDNLCIELSSNNATWTDISSTGSSPSTTSCRSRSGAIPSSGYTVSGTTYFDETNAFINLPLSIPLAFTNQSVVYLRYHVETDSSVTSGGLQDNLEGVSIANIRVLNSTNHTVWQDTLTTSTSMFHYSIGGNADDWIRTNVNAGFFTMAYGFEDSPAAQPSSWPAGWSTSTIAGTDGWEFGAINWASGGPSSFSSAPFGFGMNLDGDYMASAWEHLFTPGYQVPAGARVRFTFAHWICSENGWDSGALYISTNNNSWAHVNPGAGFYDGTAGFGATNLAGLEVWDGRNTVPTGQFNCAGPHGMWDTKQVDLSQYSGQTVWFRFSFESDTFAEQDGWYVDDVGLEVDEFLTEGTWTSNSIPIESLGNGFVDIDATVPVNTSVTATITTANGAAIGGMTNRSLPLSLAGIDRDSIGSIKIELNLFTDDIHITPIVHGLRVGSVRTFDPSGGGNGWQIPSGMEPMGLTMNNTAGSAQTLTSPFVASTAPIGSIALSGIAATGVTFQAIDATGNIVGNAGIGSSIAFSTPQPGFGMQISVPANGWLGNINMTGQFVQPAQNPTVDVTDDGSIDWSFPESDAYGLFGWQQLFSSGGVASDSAQTVTLGTGGSGNGPNGAGTTSMTVLNTVYWDGSYSFDRLELLCGITSCGNIVSNGTVEITANEIAIAQGTSITSNGVVFGGSGSGNSISSASGGCCGAGGAGHGAAGGAGGGANGGNAGLAYGSSNETGSSGGNITSSNGYGALGGGGGGFIHLIADQIWVNGTIRSNGGDGASGAAPAGGTGAGGPGAGGGSGGSIHMEANSISLGNSNLIEAQGGTGGTGANGQQSGIGIGMFDGGDGGGGAAGGKILLGDAQSNLVTLLLNMNGDTPYGYGGGGGSAYGSGAGGTTGNNGASGTQQAYRHSGFSRATTVDFEVLIPANATATNGLISIAPASDTFLSDIDIDIAGVSLTSIANGSGSSEVLLSAAALAAIQQTSGTHTDPQTGRSWREVTLTLDASVAQVVKLTSATFGYELVDNVSGLTTQLRDYHAAAIGNNPPPSVSIPTTIHADIGAVSIDGGIYHELMITNLPFTVPTTLYPDGQMVYITTKHHHLHDNSLIDSIGLTGQGSDGSEIEFLLEGTSNLATATFSQLSGGVQVTLSESASTVSEMPGSNGFTDIVVEWAFEVLWTWDDVATIDWTVNALDSAGEGIAPAFATSGGVGAQAVENDLEVDGFTIKDSFDRTLSNPFSSDYPFPVLANSEISVDGSVRFQNTAGRRPMMDAFSAAVIVNDQPVLLNSTAPGLFAGIIQLPTSQDVAINIVTTLPTVGPANGSTGAEDATITHPVYSMIPDSTPPTISGLQVSTSFGMLDANGFVWDPSSPLVLHSNAGDEIARSDKVTLRYWREGLDDDNRDGIPDLDEYLSVMVSLSDGQPGNQQVTYPAISVSQMAFNDRVSLFIEGTDWAGITYLAGGSGGAPGFDADWATLFVATNEPTTLLADGLDIDDASGYLLAGQKHTISMDISDLNGVTTLDEIEIRLCGAEFAPLGVFRYDPRQDVLESDNGSHVEPMEARIINIDEEVSRVEIDFTVLWSWPSPDENTTVCQPGITIIDDEVLKENVNNIGELAWMLDNQLLAMPNIIEDLTPPLSQATGTSIAVQQGDELSISGSVIYAKSREPMINIPEGMQVSAQVAFGSSVIEAVQSIASDSSFEVPIVLPSRTPITPTIPVLLSVLGVPENGGTEIDQTIELVVDSTAPIIVFDALRYPTGSLTLLETDRLEAVRVQAIVEDAGGMPTGDLVVHWVYLRNGLPIAGSGGDDAIPRSSVTGYEHLHEGFLNIRPSNGIALIEGDQLAIWFDATDRAGNPLIGTGTEDSPRVPALRIIEFVPIVDSIESSPHFPHVGQIVKIDVTMDNLGLRPGNVSVQVAEQLSDGTWVGGIESEFMFGPGDTGVTHTFEWEAWNAGEPNLYLVLDGDFDNASKFSEIQVQSIEEGSAGAFGSTAVIGGLALIALVVIGLSVVLILNRNSEEWDEEEGWGEEGTVSEAPPAPVSSEGVDEEVVDALTMLPDDWTASRIEQYRAKGWSISQIVTNYSIATADEPPAPARLKGDSSK